MAKGSKLDRQTPEQVAQEMQRAAAGLGIPHCPAILLDVRAEIRSANANLRRIDKLISGDVGLAALLLKTVNSPFYGLRVKVSSVRHAIGLLGLAPLSRVLSTLLLRRAFAGGDRARMERFWETSTQVAAACAWLAGEGLGASRDEAHAFGLFQGCGIPILMKRFPGYAEAPAGARPRPGRPSTEAEDAAYGTNHAAVGALLAKSWHLPEAIIEAIRNHHDYLLLDDPDGLPAESRTLISLGAMAERAVELRGKSDLVAEWDRAGPAALSCLGLTERAARGLLERAGRALDAA